MVDLEHSPLPILIGLVVYTVAISALPNLLPSMYQWVLLIAAGISALIYATAPVIAMGRMVKAAQVNFIWAFIAVFLQLMLWSFIFWLVSVAFDMDLSQKVPDLDTFKRLFDTANLKFDKPWHLLGGTVVYIAVNSLVYNAVLMASHIQAVAITIGTDLIRLGLLVLLAWLLTVW